MKILFGSYKGGPGKSTLAINFAIMLAKQGRDVLLVDSDRQGSSTLWAAIRATHKHTPTITCMSAFGETVNVEIEKMASKFDDVIIDTAGHDAIELRSAMLAADILVTPVEIAVFSTATLGMIQQVIRYGRSFNRNLKCFLVPNRVSTNKSRGAIQMSRFTQAADAISEFIITKSYLHERSAFPDTTELGRVVEEGNDPKAKAEIKAVFEEIVNGY